MKTLQELKEASLVELATNAKEWKIKTATTIDNWFRLIVFREYMNGLPEYIRTCNRLQWEWANLIGWFRTQSIRKRWAILSGLATLLLLMCILIMTWIGLSLLAQAPVLFAWVIAGLIFVISASGL